MKTTRQYALIRGFFVMFLMLVISVFQTNAQEVQFPPKNHPDTDNWQKVFETDLSNAIDPDRIWSFE
ncbi:MAG: hypothetical protein V5A51_09310, partial [Bacteroidales bacterium]